MAADTLKKRIKLLLRGTPEEVMPWLAPGRGGLGVCVLIIVCGAGIYGATLGLWNGERQAVFNTIKFPLLILLTTVGNGLLNGMLAQLLGARLTFQQTLKAILLSFVIASMILGSLSPVTLFLLYNTPPLASGAQLEGYAFIMLAHVFVIAFAGIIANLRLLELLTRFTDSKAVALRVLAAWLAGNLLLGSQLSWNLRPFVGSPHLPTQFIRTNAFEGNFFEAVNWQIKTLTKGGTTND